MPSNKPIEECGELIGDVRVATAILGRFLQHAEIIAITGKSYAMKDEALKQNAHEPRRGAI